MSVEENIQLMRRWFQEVWDEGRTETVYELFSADGIARGQNSADGELHGPQEFEGFVRKIRGSFSDMKIKVEDVFGAGDRVALTLVGGDEAYGGRARPPSQRPHVAQLRNHHCSVRRREDRRRLGQLGSTRHAGADRRL